MSRVPDANGLVLHVEMSAPATVVVVALEGAAGRSEQVLRAPLRGQVRKAARVLSHLKCYVTCVSCSCCCCCYCCLSFTFCCCCCCFCCCCYTATSAVVVVETVVVAAAVVVLLLDVVESLLEL